MRSYFLLIALILVAGAANAAQAPAQVDAPTIDTIRMSNAISKQTGVPTIAAVRSRGEVSDVEVRFGGPVKNYKGAMDSVVANVGATSKAASYKTEWCYILTRELGRERILISDVIHTLALGLAGKKEEAWTYFESKKQRVK